MSVPPQAVVFDNDGLLLDTEEAWTRAERTLFAGLGREFTLEHKRILIGSSRVGRGAQARSDPRAPRDGRAADRRADRAGDGRGARRCRATAGRGRAARAPDRRRRSRSRSPRTPSARFSSARSRAPGCCTTARFARSSQRRTSHGRSPRRTSTSRPAGAWAPIRRRRWHSRTRRPAPARRPRRGCS